MRRRVSDLPSLAREIVKAEGIAESELRPGGRSKRVSKARKPFCQLAVKRMGHPEAEVARFLGVTTSAVSRSANSADIPEPSRYIDQFGKNVLLLHISLLKAPLIEF